MSDGLLATYEVAADDASIAARARDICVEQTVEVTEPLCADPAIADRVVGRLEGVRPLRPGVHEVRIRYPALTLTHELTQLVSVLFGNISLKSGVRLVAIDLDPAYARRFAGPRHGGAGVRAAAGAPDRPLLMSAVKPLGRTASELATYAYGMALGGIDLIKDDHGIADPATSPFEERVERCCEAVARANARTGGRSAYYPCVTGPADAVLARARFAKAAGAGGVLIAPLVAGLDFVRVVAVETGLPVMAHPALAGAYLAPGHGIAHGVLLGTLMRLAGADMVVFPSWGGRFPFTRDDCESIARALQADLHGLRPALPVPAGGLTLERVPELVRVFGREVVFLIGSALYERSPDLAANAAWFRGLVEAGAVGGIAP
jgi:ribulose-bisphosphate carboxylase large chain